MMTARSEQTASEKFCLFQAGFETCDCGRCQREMARRAYVATLPVVKLEDIHLDLTPKPRKRARR